ncbi:MAG: ADP-ribosylglycohydrolase family protein [Thermoleophilia bacterium]|nr:ADP-ribosylglycohydrolase family protein [Thermoleophilia bacterium]
MPDRRSRYRGALLGLAAGDALGTTLEFEPPGTFDSIDDIVGGGPFRLEPGQWTDDTSMALCLAESLLERRAFDLRDQMERYLRWYRAGHLSSTGECFDIGNATRAALERFERTGEPFAGSTDANAAGNGSLMRLAPVPLFFGADVEEALARAADSSRTTHGAATCVDACRYFAALLVGAVDGLPKDELLSPRYWHWGELHREVADVAAGSFRGREPPEIRGTGYVVRSLEAALWALERSDGFREGALLAVNLGDDADTTGAVYGQLAGALYGEEAIPREWRAKLALRETIEDYAERLYRLSCAGPVPDSYWVVPGRLLAGEYPGSADELQAQERLAAFAAAGVTCFLDLTEESEGLRAYARLLDEGITVRRHPVVDLGCPSSEEMAAILDEIDAARAAGEVVYVHCWGGIGRTGTVVGCWLVRHGRSGEQALELVRRRRAETPDGRRASPETPAQRAMVLAWRPGA